MKREIDDFLEEITNNFSELFVETFLLRFLDEFDKNILLDSVEVASKKLNNKVGKNFIKKLKKMGYKDINRMSK